jgi:TRAP transporter TAXI family solute receptor
MIASDQLESGIAQSDIVSWGYAGTGIFSAGAPIKQLRAIASLFLECLQLVVRADGAIQTITDLKRRRVSLGQIESGTAVDARIVLLGSGLPDGEVNAEYMRPGMAASGLAEGTLDAFFIIGGLPVPLLRELAEKTSLRLIPIDDAALGKIQAEGPYRRAVIPGGTYTGIGADTPSIGFHALWVVSVDAPDDLIYAITKALWSEATRRLLATHDPIGKQVRLENALEGITVPLHPGAKRFYLEAGLRAGDDELSGKRN